MKRRARWINGLFLAVIPIGLYSAIRHQKRLYEERAFNWVAKYVNAAKVLPSRHQKIWSLKAVCEGRNALFSVEKKFGVSARSRAEFGYLALVGGNYQAAQSYFDEASRLGVQDHHTKARLVEFDRSWRVAKFVLPNVPNGYSLAALSSITVENTEMWAALYMCRQDKPLIMEIFAAKSTRWVPVQHIAIMPSVGGACQLFVHDLTGDGNPEIIVSQMNFDSGGNRDHIQIFRWNSRRFSCIYCQPDRLSSWFKDLDHDGTYEIGSYVEIGDSPRMCHANQPRWLDVFSLKDGRYIAANNDFPQEFKDWPQELLSTATAFPDAGEIWWHLGKAYETQKQVRAARSAYRQALTIYRRNVVRDRSLRTKIQAVQADLKSCGGRGQA